MAVACRHDSAGIIAGPDNPDWAAPCVCQGPVHDRQQLAWRPGARRSRWRWSWQASYQDCWARPDGGRFWFGGRASRLDRDRRIALSW